MRKIVVGAFVSLDGVMQAPGGPEEDPTGGFEFGGWVAPLFDEKGGEAVGEMFSSPFDLLLGRKTYDIFAAHWPYAPEGDPIGTVFDRVTKYVATRDPDRELTWQNSRTLGDDPVATLIEMKREDGPDLLTQGSTDFLETLLEHGLVDAFNIFTFPVILGRGKRLFGDMVSPVGLKLRSSLTTPNGILASRYEVVGLVATGSFEFAEPTEAELRRRRNLT